MTLKSKPEIINFTSFDYYKDENDDDDDIEVISDDEDYSDDVVPNDDLDDDDDMLSNVCKGSKEPIVNIAHPPNSLSSEDGSNKMYVDLAQRYEDSYSSTMFIGYSMKYDGKVVYVGGSEALCGGHRNYIVI